VAGGIPGGHDELGDSGLVGDSGGFGGGAVPPTVSIHFLGFRAEDP
jgi:hypothetical protein